jgi:hypothetical protein
LPQHHEFVENSEKRSSMTLIRKPLLRSIITSTTAISRFLLRDNTIFLIHRSSQERCRIVASTLRLAGTGMPELAWENRRVR